MNTSQSQQLELLGASLAEHNYPGYPEHDQRLYMSLGELSTSGSLLPAGPWETSPRQFPTGREQAEFRKQGLQLETNGRPLHPWFVSMATNPNIGVVTGRGAYWNWGPNYTADPIILHENNVLLVRRQDTNLWALSGGFVDPGETGDIAARREAHEESNIVLTDDDLVGEVYRGPVVDLRVTANAWPETTALLYKLSEYQEPDASNDEGTAEAKWWKLDSIGKDVILFGAHQFLLNTALAYERANA
jgi:ADP-ribose pyrophosphatase YjhB (NUDIX family)